MLPNHCTSVRGKHSRSSIDGPRDQKLQNILFDLERSKMTRQLFWQISLEKGVSYWVVNFLFSLSAPMQTLLESSLGGSWVIDSWYFSSFQDDASLGNSMGGGFSKDYRWRSSSTVAVIILLRFFAVQVGAPESENILRPLSSNVNPHHPWLLIVSPISTPHLLFHRWHLMIRFQLSKWVVPVGTIDL